MTIARGDRGAQVITVHAQELVQKLHALGIGTPSCKNTFITMADIGLSSPLPPDVRLAAHHETIRANRQHSFCKQLWHGRVIGHGLSHWVMGAGGHTRSTVEEIYQQVTRGRPFPHHLCAIFTPSDSGLCKASDVEHPSQRWVPRGISISAAVCTARHAAKG